MSGQPVFAPPPFQTDLLHDVARQEIGTTTATTTTTTSHKRKREDSPQPHSSPKNDLQGDVDGTTTTTANNNNNNDTENNNPQDTDEGHPAQQDPNGSSNPANATSTAAAALAGIFPNMTAPQPSFRSSASAGEPDRNLDPPFAMGADEGSQPQHAAPVFDLDEVARRAGMPRLPANLSAPPVSTLSKPIVGSEEWHRVRRDNHKEVERRRRETINEGINELAKIVPGCEKNKGSILQRAISFITQLKENEQQNIEKWTLEKLLTEQAITELSASNDKYKSECERAWREAEHWKKMCEDAGLISPKGDVATATDDNNTKESDA